MTLRTLFTQIERTKKLPESAVICFSSPVYSVLFFYHIFSFLKKHGTIISYISCGSTDTASIKALLSTISLSDTMQYYWLEGVHALSVKKQQELLAYFKVYDGPHRILFFTQETSIVSPMMFNGVRDMIVLPEKITPHEFSMVRFLINDQIVTQSSEFAQQIAAYTDHLSLDSACLFAHYEAVVGKNITDFFSQWVVNIIEPTSSLFLLSQHFFGKKQGPLFRQWATMAELYMPSFWATFWADQIWRAYIFCDLMKKKKYVESKKAQYKLPFSFINRDWSSYSATELRNAHHFLFDLDYRLKNGATDIGLEYFYNQFFDNKFAVK